MVDKRKLKTMEAMNKIYKVVQQSSTNGITAIAISEKTGIIRQTVHRHLNSLELMGKVKNSSGIWYPDSSVPKIKTEKPDFLQLIGAYNPELIEQALREIELKNTLSFEMKAVAFAEELKKKGRSMTPEEREQFLNEIIQSMTTSKVNALKELKKELGYDA